MSDPRKTVQLTDATESEDSPSASDKKQKIKEIIDAILFWAMTIIGLMFFLYLFLAPPKSASGLTRTDAIVETVWLIIIIPAMMIILYVSFRPLIDGVFWFLVDLSIFLYKITIKSTKLLIRGICGIPNALKRVEQWSRER